MPCLPRTLAGSRWDKRQFLASMATELDEWFKRAPEAPNLDEAPGRLAQSFSTLSRICGEGECIKTLYTIYAPGKPRRGSVDLDKWEKQR